MLKIENLHVEIDGNEIVKGLDLEVGKGEIHAIMGPNGSGKSTLANVMMGHPRYEVTDGSITFEGEDVLELEPDERAKMGMFLAFQYPSEVPGVSVANFLRTAVNSVREEDRKSTRLNSSHANISYAVFCLKKKKIILNLRIYVITT